MPEALNMALKGLNLLGIVLPEDEKEQELAFLADIKTLQEKMTLNNLGDLLCADCSDKVQLSIFKLYVQHFIPSLLC